jgi:hypothetical protein
MSEHKTIVWFSDDSKPICSSFGRRFVYGSFVRIRQLSPRYSLPARQGAITRLLNRCSASVAIAVVS